MSKPIPPIQKYMTTSPHTIGAEQTLDKAAEFMKEYKIRHLPVLHGGKLVGMITERDLAMIENLQGVDPTTELVDNAMTSEVYTVAPDTTLDEVATEMARQKYGSAVVMQNNKVVGVVTTVDICSALAELLKTRLS